MLAQNQKQFQRAIKQEQAARARYIRSQRKAVLSRLDSQRKALQLLGSLPNSPYVVLDTPFGVLEAPHPRYAVGFGNDPWNSFVKFLIEATSDTDVSDNPEFGFYYRWFNESSEPAVVNVSTSPLLQGVCEVTSEPTDIPLPGNFADIAELSLTAQLSLFETWNDPITTQPAFQESQVVDIAQLSAQGANLLHALNGESSVQYQAITDSFEVSYKSFVIPARSLAVFEVGLLVPYGIGDPKLSAIGWPGGSTGTVSADFANDNSGYRVTSLAVLLEIVNHSVLK
jgi:hypothetical protein